MSSGRERRRRERDQSRERRTVQRAQSRERRTEQREARRRGAEPQQPIWTRPEPGARRARLSREEIARAALQIADTDGIEALSMRRVASELEVGTMSLYYYVQTKAELLDLMHDEMMGEVVVPEGELPDDWRGALEAIARRALEATRRHPWSLDSPPTVAGPNGMRHFEQSLAAVSGLDVGEQTRFEIIFMVDDYVFGFALREVEEQREAEEWGEPHLAAILEYFESILASGEFPHVESLRHGEDARTAFERIQSFESDPDRFERGLKRMLDGIALELGELPA
jgi:AcrR family transcriptional regulator